MFLADAPNPYLAAPPWLNAGDTAWQLTSATLVGLMSLPGLAILYGGLVKKKWALNSAVMCFYAFSIVLVVWMLWGYNMAFGQGVPGALTNYFAIPKPALEPLAKASRDMIPGKNASST